MDVKKITLRDYFAGKALQAMVSNPRTTESLNAALTPEEVENHISDAVYKMADAMMKRRDK